MKKKFRRIILWELKETAAWICFKCLRKPRTFLTMIKFFSIHFYSFLGTDSVANYEVSPEVAVRICSSK